MKLLGMKIKGRVLLFSQSMYEFSFITIADKTTIDTSHVTGHYAVYNDVKLGPSNISGIMHEDSYAAKTSITTGESAALRSFVGMSETSSTAHLEELDSSKNDEEMCFQK